MRPIRRLPLFLSLTVVALLLAPSTALGGAFPGANGRLVFERAQLLHTVNPDGSDERTITSSQYYAREPAVAPDGNRIAFGYAPARVGVSGYGIWVINADGTGARQVTTDPETVARGDSDPAWSPDGSKIAFVRGQSGTGISDLLVMNADGSGGTTNLTATFAGSVNDPEWSPAGDRIAFSSGFDVFLVGADGASPPVQITPRGGLARGYPSWSPDGSRIAYKQGGEIRVTSPDGTNNVLLAGGFREIWEIAWSPDGSKIALINDPGTDITVQEELFIMNADGTGAARPATRVDTNTTLDWGRQGTLAASAAGHSSAAGLRAGLAT